MANATLIGFLLACLWCGGWIALVAWSDPGLVERDVPDAARTAVIAEVEKIAAMPAVVSHTVGELTRYESESRPELSETVAPVVLELSSWSPKAAEVLVALEAAAERLAADDIDLRVSVRAPGASTDFFHGAPLTAADIADLMHRITRDPQTAYGSLRASPDSSPLGGREGLALVLGREPDCDGDKTTYRRHWNGVLGDYRHNGSVRLRTVFDS